MDVVMVSWVWCVGEVDTTAGMGHYFPDVRRLPATIGLAGTEARGAAVGIFVVK